MTPQFSPESRATEIPADMPKTSNPRENLCSCDFHPIFPRLWSYLARHLQAQDVVLADGKHGKKLTGTGEVNSMFDRQKPAKCATDTGSDHNDHGKSPANQVEVTVQVSGNPKVVVTVVGDAAADSGASAAAAQQNTETNSSGWTQAAVDDAIREFKARNSAPYNKLLAAVRAKQPGAIEAARGEFGRNAVARALGIKSPAMVSKSGVWRQIANELQLGNNKKAGPPRQPIGFDIACEEKSVELFGEQVSRQEALRRIEEAYSSDPETAKAVIQELQSGGLTDERLAELAEICVAQRKDDDARRVYRRP